MSDHRIYVAGSRTFAAEVVDFARDAGFEVVGLLEPYDEERVGQTIHGLPVTWLDHGPALTVLRVAAGTGESRRRALVDRLLASGWQPTTIVHPRAHVAPSATVGVGAIVAPGVVLGAQAHVADHSVIGRGALVGHHTEIGPFATLGPGANVAGNVSVGADVHVAMGAVVRDHVTLGAGSVVAMGAVVVRDVPEGAEVRGVPATVVEERAPAT
jgi:sugar O-acyltransferase (sialic acid O-acetyltransferase NeuD family)